MRFIVMPSQFKVLVDLAELLSCLKYFQGKISEKTKPPSYEWPRFKKILQLFSNDES